MDDHNDTSDNGSENRGDAPADRLIQTMGTVKWFDPRKGFGFIVGPDEQDIFVHFTVIEGDGFRVLKDGVEVCYDAECNDKGWRATKIYGASDDDGPSDDTPEVVIPRRTYSRTPRR